MAITAQKDSQEWEQEEHVAALFRADYDRWTGCRQTEASPSYAWLDRKTRVAASAYNSAVIYGGHGTGKSSALLSNCSRAFWGRHAVSSTPTRSFYETERLRPKFQILVDEWRRETRFSSSSDETILHPAYQTIMTMGYSAVPLVLETLEKSRGHWFWALHFMTGEDPVPEGANIAQARNAWINWGREKGLLT